MLVIGMKPHEQICIRDRNTNQVIIIKNYLGDKDHSERRKLAFDAPNRFNIYREKIK